MRRGNKKLNNITKRENTKQSYFRLFPNLVLGWHQTRVTTGYRQKIKGPLRPTHGCPKKATDKKFQIQNYLAPVLQCFVINWNGSKSDRNERKQWSKQRLKRLYEMAIKRTQTKRMDVLILKLLLPTHPLDPFDDFKLERSDFDWNGKIGEIGKSEELENLQSASNSV